MLPQLKKKKAEATSALPMPAWHPNLRNYHRLPDTKVVRTAFVVTGVTVLVALVLLLGFAYEAYRLRDISRQNETWQRQIDRDRQPSEQAIALFKKFQAESARVNEVSAFVGSRPVLSELFLHVAQTLPAYLALDRFDLRENVATLRGTVRGSPDQASGYASAYLQQLKSDPVFLDAFREINLVGLNRNAQTGRLALEITLKLKDDKKP